MFLPAATAMRKPHKISSKALHKGLLCLFVYASSFAIFSIPLGVHWCILQLNIWQFLKSICFRSIKVVCCAQRIVRFVSKFSKLVCFLVERVPFTTARKHPSHPRQKHFLRPVTKTSEIESQICNKSKLDFRAFIEVSKQPSFWHSMCPHQTRS